jgi:uncharacterized protein
MKLQLQGNTEEFAITGHGAGFVQVGAQRIASPLILLPGRLIAPWQLVDPSRPAMEDFGGLLDCGLEVVIFGSGSSFRFADPHIYRAFAARGVGFDSMDTPAACRTYNVLMSEGRRVAAALLV